MARAETSIRKAIAWLLVCSSLGIASCEASEPTTNGSTGGTYGFEGEPPGSGGVGGSGEAGSGGFGGSSVAGTSGGSAGTGGGGGENASNSGSGASGGTGGSSDPSGGVGGSSEGGGGDASVDAGSEPRFHVFLLLGQSNMAGYPKATAADDVEDDRIRVLGYDECGATGRHKDTWAVASPPLHECWNGAIGPGDYFAKTLIEQLPEGDTIGLVPCAISGERIETFLKDGGSKYAWIVERAKLAQAAGGVIEGILFHQGESNNGDPSWPGKVRTLIEDLRADLEVGDVPFLAGELAYDGGCAGHNTLVNMLPTVVSNAFVVSASGLALDPADSMWHLHFGRDAQVTFGERYAAKMIEALSL